MAMYGGVSGMNPLMVNQHMECVGSKKAELWLGKTMTEGRWAQAQ